MRLTVIIKDVFFNKMKELRKKTITDILYCVFENITKQFGSDLKLDRNLFQATFDYFF